MSLLQNSNAISAGGYDINNSLRFRASASAYLSRTLTTPTDSDVWTFSFWVKRGSLGSTQEIITSSNTTANQCGIEFNSSDQLRIINYIGSAFKTQYVTTQVFRDPSAWYHIVIRQNSSSGFFLYVNGVQVTAFGTATGPDASDWLINQSGRTVNIGREQLSGISYLDGYLAEVNFIDGQALTPSSFGETDAVTGSWVAKKYTGTYGTNGFYLPFSDTDSNENLSLGSQTIGGSYWAVGSVTATQNNAVAPDGTTTAAKLQATAADCLTYSGLNGFNAGQTYTWSVYLKADSNTSISLLVDKNGSGTAGYETLPITVTTSWQRFSVTFIPVSTTPAILIGGGASFSSPEVVYAWGSQVNHGTIARKYIATTGTVVTNQGIAENKVLYSEDATNAAWNKLGVTATSNTITAPNGTSTADSILETATTGLHVILPTTSLTLAAATIHTASLYVKPINNVAIQLALDDTASTNGGYANYDLINGTVVGAVNYGIGFGINASITSAGSGWYRISLSTSIGSGTTARFAITAIPTTTAGFFPSYAGNTSNGYYVWGMQVEESSTLGPYLPTAASAQGKVHRIGADRSLGSTSFGYNTWIPNNISLTRGTTYDAMIDVPTNTSETVANYCTLNPLKNGGMTLSEGNLTAAYAPASWVSSAGTIAVSSGKWYFEDSMGGISPSVYTMFGIRLADVPLTTYLADDANGWGILANSGNISTYTNAVATNLIAFSSTTSTIYQVAIDVDAGKLWLGYNNNWVGGGSPSAGTSPTYTLTANRLIHPVVSSYGNTSYVNFGQRPFGYTPPTGFKALNTYNLPDSTIKKGNRYMDATLVTATGTTQTVTNAGGFKPDLLIVKTRAVVGNNNTIDSVRGVANYLITDTTGAELTASTFITSFNSNGWTFGTGNYPNGTSLVGWQWQAGQGTTSSNTAGSITSTVSVNPTAGFSIVTYTGTGANATVGHGLGVAPKMIIIKSRGNVDAWRIYHEALGNTKFINFDIAAAGTASTVWNNTTPTSSVFTLGTESSVNGSGRLQVAYCWAEIAGFSKFGSYTGNGSTNGPFVYTGFRPKFVMYKRTDTTGNWQIEDTSRATYNAANAELFANLSIAEYTTAGVEMDILSNGFKLRNTNADRNANNGTYIYMAFAENPFKNSNAR